jgi:hypothetical protein
LCLSRYQFLNVYTNIYYTCCVYHGIWTNVNGVLHKSMSSVCESVCVSHYRYPGNEDICNNSRIVGHKIFHAVRFWWKENIRLVLPWTPCFEIVSWGGVRQNPLDTSATVWPIVWAQDDGWWWEWSTGETKALGENLASLYVTNCKTCLFLAKIHFGSVELNYYISGETVNTRVKICSNEWTVSIKWVNCKHLIHLKEHWSSKKTCHTEYHPFTLIVIQASNPPHNLATWEN